MNTNQNDDPKSEQPDLEAPETAVEGDKDAKKRDKSEKKQPPVDWESELATLKSQLDETKSKYLYLFSDFENYKRNAVKERFDLMQTAGRDIMTVLLPVLDDFDRASKSGTISEGVALIQQKLENTLQHKGLRSMETAPGDAFDPEFHEAIAEIPAASEELKGKIVDILEKGYLLSDKIIRHAKVVVGK